MSDQQRELTLGEMRVGISFNPSNNEKVDSLKKKAAAFIDELESYRPKESLPINAEINRLISLAQTETESAAMWGVKAVTKK